MKTITDASLFGGLDESLMSQDEKRVSHKLVMMGYAFTTDETKTYLATEDGKKVIG